MVGSLKSRESRDYTSSSSTSSFSSSPSRSVGSALSSGSFNRIPLDRGLAPQSVIENSSDLEAEAPWELRLSFGQLIIFWSVICGSLIMVFLFGLYAGREQGVQAALDGRSGEAVRLPIMNAQPSDLLSNPIAAVTGETAISVSEQPAPVNAAAAAVPVEVPAAELNPPSLPQPATEEKSAESVKGDAVKSESVKSEFVKAAEPPARESALLAELEKPEISPALPPPTEKIEKKLAKPEPVKTVRSESIRPGWYLQVAATRTSSESTGIVKKLQAAGLKPVVESAQIDGSAYFRVVLGPYGSKDAALKARKAVIRSKAAKGDPFPKQIK